MNGAKYLAEMLHGYGVGSVFFVPFVTNRALVEMERLGIQRVLCHTEKAAAYMADGYARVAHRPGVAMAQSVGAANLAAGLQDAYLGRAPVLAITGRRPTIQRYRDGYQEVNHWPLFDPVTKYNVYADAANDLPVVLRQAFREMTSGAPAPAHVELLGFTAEIVETDEAEMNVVVEEAFTSYPAFRPEPDPEAIRAAARVLEGARRPVMVAGGGVRASGAEQEIVALAERLRMPVATSLNGKGTIADDHELSVGVVGSYSRWCANRVVWDADVVLFVGSRAGGMTTEFWQVPAEGTTTVQLDIEAAAIGSSYPTANGVQGDARASLRALLAELGDAERDGAWAARAAGLVTEWREELEPLLTSDAVPIRPERLCREITDFLPDDAVLVADTGHAGIWAGTMIDLTEPGQNLIRCAGSLGWAFPAALGAKCAAPERPVICFTGDGGFWYHLSELETAARCGINTITVVNNNRSLNQGRPAVERAYGGPGGGGDALWVFDDIDFAKVAESMGCVGIRVTEPGEIAGALKEALAMDRPVVVDVRSDPDVMAPTPVVPEG